MEKGKGIGCARMNKKKKLKQNIKKNLRCFLFHKKKKKNNYYFFSFLVLSSFILETGVRMAWLQIRHNENDSFSLPKRMRKKNDTNENYIETKKTKNTKNGHFSVVCVKRVKKKNRDHLKTL